MKAFEIFQIMSDTNADIKLAPLKNIIRIDIHGQSGEVTFGIPREVAQELMDDVAKKAIAEFGRRGVVAVKQLKAALVLLGRSQYKLMLSAPALVQYKRQARGCELREVRYFDAFDNYEFMGFNDPDMRPDAGTCECCPSWDDVNGCWDNCRTIMQCKRMGEGPRYSDAEWDNEEQDYV